MKKFLVALCVFFAAALCLFSCGETALNSRDELESRLRMLGFLSASESEELESELYYAVFNFQKANAIPASGTLDPTTTEAILSDSAVSYGEYLESYSRSAGTDLALGFKDSGKNVRNLQSALAGLGYYDGSVNGEYTMETACAVAMFEAVNGLEPDGYADRYMIGKMLSPSALAVNGFEALETLSFGDRGVLVKYCQRILSSLGYFEGDISGVFGEYTRKAVLSFEWHNGLETTGAWHIRYSVMAKNAMALSKSQALEKELSDVLSVGDESYQVYEMKLRLSELGYYTGTLDHSFDERMRLALIAFQEANLLEMTGSADAATKAALYADDCVAMQAFADQMNSCALSYGQTSYSVYLLTRRLQALGYPLETSWNYDDAVASQVAMFQYAQGLAVADGVDEEARALMNSPRALDYASALPIALERQAESDQAREFLNFMQAVQSAVGKPYEAGMTGPDSFGIGGLAYYCYSLVGIDMPPTAALQLESAQKNGSLIDDTSRINAGAQLFFRDENQLYTAIAASERTLIYASPAQGRIVEADVNDILGAYAFAGLIVYFYAP